MPPLTRRHPAAHRSGSQSALYECSVAQPSGSQSALQECSVAQTSYGEPSTPHKRRAVPVSQLHLRHRPILYPNTLMLLLFHCAILYSHGAAESDVGRATSSPSRLGSGAWSPRDPSSAALWAKEGPVPALGRAEKMQHFPETSTRTSRTSATSSTTSSESISFQISVAGLYLLPLFGAASICFMHQPRGPPHMERRIPPAWGP